MKEWVAEDAWKNYESASARSYDVKVGDVLVKRHEYQICLRLIPCGMSTSEHSMKSIENPLSVVLEQNRNIPPDSIVPETISIKDKIPEVPNMEHQIIPNYDENIAISD